MSESPRVLIILDRGETSAAVLRPVGSFTGAGLLTIRDRITVGEPVIDEEMFTNAWFDERAEQLLALIVAWQRQGISFELREITVGGDAAEPLEVETLRNMIDTAKPEVER